MLRVSGQPKQQRSVGRSVGQSTRPRLSDGSRGQKVEAQEEPKVVGRKECPKAKSRAREARCRRCQHGEEGPLSESLSCGGC
jgi:hypothetical protein